MATSGSKSVKVTDWDTLKFSWTAKIPNIAANTTTVTWKMELIATGAGYIYSTASKAWSVTVNGTKYSGSNTVGINNNSTKTLASGSTVIKHNDDGTKSFDYSFSQTFNIDFNGWVGTKSGSGSGTLDTIPRASQPSCITWPEHTQNVGFFGDEISIHTNRAATGFTHTLRYKFGSKEGTIATGVTNDTTWVIPKSLMELIPNNTSGSGTIYADTYSVNTLIGTKSCGFTAKVPTSSDCYPTGSFTLEDVSGWDKTYGSPVQGLSQIKIKVNATLAYKSPIASYEVTAEGVKYTTQQATTGILKTAGQSKISAKIKDKRGRSGSFSYTMQVKAYAPPSISALSVHRCHQSGEESDQGDYIKVVFSAAITALNNKNTAAYTLQYKKSTDSNYTTYTYADLANVYSVSEKAYIFAADNNSSYDVKLEAADRHGTATRSTSASTAFTLMNWGADGDSMGIFKVAEKKGYLEIGQKMEVENPIELADGDVKLLTLTAAYKNYGSSTANQPRYRKNAAGMVELWGVVSPTSATNGINNDAAVIICTLPQGYRPAQGFYVLCPGSGNAMWMLSVATDGTVGASRHRDGTGRTQPGTSAWLPFHATFIAK